MTNVEEPPNKRRRQTAEDDDDTLRALLVEEIDHEIALRARLQETVQSRLTWALILQDTLEKHFSLPQSEDVGPSVFLHSALDAYNATSEPAAFLLLEDTSPPESLLERIAQAQIVAESPSLSQLSGRPRHLPRQNNLHHDDRIGKEPNKYLYIRDLQSTPPMVYKLACPDCARSDFPRLQGLLNHCRLKHKREFGSHDECIQHSASIVPEEDQAWVMEHGLEITGMSASLRRLFEIAVGASGGVLGRLDQSAAEGAPDAKFGSSDDEDAPEEEATMITKTLGHHKDTPALAPFLRRAPKKKQIHVHEDIKSVDIIEIKSIDEHVPKWTMHYQERSGVTSADDGEFDTTMEEVTTSGYSEARTTVRPPTLEGGSRFHISARLAISDWSMRLSEGEIKKDPTFQNATHRWMIQVKAPSYSLHESIVLKKVTVSPISEPPPPGFSGPLSVSEPPFCVLGISNHPFLARITLEWAGTQNNAMQVEHWVELEVGRYAKPVMGDEQFIDVELDRNTELLPRCEDAWAVDWRSESEKKRAARRDLGTGSASSKVSDPPHIALLKTLLPRFPMTARDAGLRVVPRTLPYYLPLSVKQFNDMVPGRQKAIEWGRARALWESYSRTEQSGTAQGAGPAIVAPPTHAENHERFSGPMDVYRWLEKEGHFPRTVPSRSDIKQKNSNGSGDLVANATLHSSGRDESANFCAFCGLSTRSHGKHAHGSDAKQPKEKEKEREKDGDSVISRVCPLPEWSMRMPLLDVDFVRSHIYKGSDAVGQATTGEVSSGAPLLSIGMELLRAEDPSLIYGVQKAASSLRLPAVDAGPLVAFEPENGREVDIMTALAPYALLATATRVLVRRLVSGGLQAMETKTSQPTTKEPGFATAHTPRPGARAAGSRFSGGGKRQILTPAHIIRGLFNRSTLASSTTNVASGTGAEGSLSATAVLVSLARLGVEVPDMRETKSADTNTAATLGEDAILRDQAANGN